MGFDRRGYYYRSVRDGDRVRRVYIGKGPAAQLAALLVEGRRSERRARSLTWRAEEARWEAAAARQRALDELGELLARAALVAAGYHQHDRGAWRRRRMNGDGAKNGMCSDPSDTPIDGAAAVPREGPARGGAPPGGGPDPGDRPLSEGELRELIGRATQGDRTVLPALRRLLDARPALWQLAGDVGRTALADWIDLIAGRDLLVRESLKRTVAALVAEVAGPAPAPLERLLAERVAAGWMQASSADRVAAIRGMIAGGLDRSGPGSKAAGFLRGLRVLVEVEAIAPGHLAGRRRGPAGWWSPLSLARDTPGREASERVAREYGVGTGTLAGEVRLAEAVEVIVQNCGVGTLGPLLAPGGRLGQSVVLSIARKGPEKQRYAMDEAARGRDPLARPAPGVWPMDTRDFAKVPGRLGRARDLVDDGIAALPALLARLRPTGGEVAELRRLSAGVVEYAGQLSRSVGGRGAGEGPARERPPKPGKTSGTRRGAPSVATVIGWLDAAEYFVEKTARDVTRLPPDKRPTRPLAAQIQAQLRSLTGRTGRLVEVIEAGRSGQGPGGDGVPRSPMRE